MLKKKLLTLAFAAGILACGACGASFVPPLIQSTPPPPPPLRIDLHGIHTIGVTVTNDSSVLDPTRLARTVVEDGNDRSQSTRIRFRVHRDGGSEEAQLKIVIRNEAAVPVAQTKPGTAQKWLLRFSVSWTLTSRDGRVLWQDDNWEVNAGTGFTTADEAKFLQELSHSWIYDELSYRLVSNMFWYGGSQ